MASQGKLHTLCGFSQELDWRPLLFVEPIPAHRICDTCDVLHRVTTFLPCRHVLCKTCHEQCLLDNARACPIDGVLFSEEDTDWRCFPFESLVCRKVMCWNKDNGCQEVMAASEMHEHFYNNCVHHSTRCPECSASVLSRNVCAHRRSNCCTYAVDNKPGNLKQCEESIQEAILTALGATFEERVRELRSGLEQAIREILHSCRIHELSRTINTLRETLIQSSEKQASAINEARLNSAKEVAGILAAQADRLNEVSQSIVEKVKLVVADGTRQCLDKLEQSVSKLRRRHTTDSDSPKKVSQTVSAIKGIIGKARQRGTEAICQKCATNVHLSVETESDQSESDSEKSSYSDTTP